MFRYTSKRLYYSQNDKLGILQLKSQKNSTDPVAQSDFYKELLARKRYSDLIHYYENQPQIQKDSQDYVPLIRKHPDNLKYYIEALMKSGRTEMIPTKVLSVFKGDSNQPLWLDSIGNTLSRTIDDLDNSYVSKSNASPSSKDSFKESTFKSNKDPDADEKKIRIIVSKEFSFATFLSKAVWRLGGVALALYLIMQTSGFSKAGFGFSAEIEPDKSSKPVSLNDVQGIEEAKSELEEIVLFLKEPSKFLELGGKLPKGVLLYGPPGTGKTFLAKAIAGEAGVPFFHMAGSEFDEMFVGLGAKRVRDLFAAARKRSPCIIFIDELDAIGGARSPKDQSHLRQSLNQLLVELDGFSSSEGVIVIGATNTPQSLDKALVRPGRFDRMIAVPLPDIRGREDILKVHTRNVVIDPKIELKTIARGTPGFSGADLANLVNQAAIKASKENKRCVTLRDLEWAKDKIIMGSERKSAVMTLESKKLTAYHEGGHALVALFTEGSMPLHKVTIIPRGQALGVTVQLPDGDQTSVTKKELNARLDVCMGGRAAEELIFGQENITTGASSDLDSATKIAKSMIMSYGMGDRFGLLTIPNSELEYSSSQTRSTAEDETRQILNTSYERVLNLLKKHRLELDRLADALLEFETLNVEQVQTVIQGGTLDLNRSL